MPNLVGIGLSQVPTNSMLGGLAYQSPDHASIENLDLKYISQINAETADTAVDVFVYDTSRDTDGGAWRKRTTHTSWYNETLNTATRGSRREFPAVAVLVLTSTSLTIYDGDDPDLPMWMVFSGSTAYNWSGTSNLYTSITCTNGIVVVGNNGGGAREITFTSDIIRVLYTVSGNFKPNGGIVTRNNPFSWSAGETRLIVNANVNDVAMTVLPNAPIDSATGLPVPTIAVATNGGISVIKDDGTVINKATSSEGASMIAFTDTNKLIAKNTNVNYIGIFVDIHTAQSTTYLGNILNASFLYGGVYESDSRYNYPNPTGYTNSNADAVNLKDKTFAFGVNDRTTATSNGINLLQYTTASDTDNNGIVVGITTSYNTGWLHGNCKGAFLSDTDATNVTGSELVNNGTFTSNYDGWTATNSTLSIVSNTLKVDDNGGNSAAYQAITTVVGETYTISFDVVEITGLTARVHVSTLEPTAGYTGTRLHESTVLGSHAVTFTATGTTTYIQFSSESTYFVRYDNISVRLAEEDRSVNNNGLQVFGTITKSAVATGAELVAYSGFTNSNYLKQPTNTSLPSASTDVFSMMTWIKTTTDSTSQYAISFGEADTNKMRALGINFTTGTLIFTTGGTSLYGGSNIGDNTWKFICCTYDGSGTAKIYSDGNLITSGSVTLVSSTSPSIIIGNNNYLDRPFDGNIALARISASAPSAAQIKKIYEDEKHLFQENAKATLYGSSDAVTALAYDEKTELLHVGTSSGRSDFNGLRRINNTTTAVTTAISAYDGSIAQQ